MAEDFAIVSRKTIAASTGTNVIAAIRDCINGVSGHWTIDTAVTATAEQLVLRPAVQDGAPAQEQRIVFRHTGAGIVQVGYAPDGGLPPSVTDIDTVSPTVWSGFRGITGTATGISSVTITNVWVAQYRDDDASGVNPASSLTVLIGTSTTWEYGAHVGRILATDNQNDPDINIFGDGLLVGVPRETNVSTSWIRGDQTTQPANSSVIRTGLTRWSYARLADVITVASTTAALADFGGQRRVVPYNFHGFGLAGPGTPDNLTMAGVIGQAKYLRLHRIALPFGGLLRSNTSGSSQDWRVVVYDPDMRQQYILWGPETEVV